MLSNGGRSHTAGVKAPEELQTTVPPDLSVTGRGKDDDGERGHTID